MFEVQFFIEVDALAKFETDSNVSGTGESRWLIAFDAFRTAILDVARKAYTNGHRTSYTLTAAHFR